MTARSEGLRSRIRQLRQAAGGPEAIAQPEADIDANASLRARVAHLEHMVQGLQDSVYREAQRHDRRLTELELRTEPAQLAAALSKDARERGL
jgi:hypothetical protein